MYLDNYYATWFPFLSTKHITLRFYSKISDYFKRYDNLKGSINDDGDLLVICIGFPMSKFINCKENMTKIFE